MGQAVDWSMARTRPGPDTGLWGFTLSGRIRQRYLGSHLRTVGPEDMDITTFEATEEEIFDLGVPNQRR